MPFFFSLLTEVPLKLLPARSALLLSALVLLTTVVPVGAQQDQDEDRRILPAQPDYTVNVLPTAMRVPLHRSAFRVTHRFTRPLGQGDFGDLVDDLFGLDGGALIGLEYRFGLFRGLQIGIHRTSLEKTIEFFGQYGVVRQGESRPVGVSAWVSVEGIDNFRDEYSTALGGIFSRIAGEHAAFYVEPLWVANTNPFASATGDSNDTFVLGLSTRLRIRPTVYVVGEWAPRLAGFDPGVDHGSFAIEKRAGGHVFQLNFSNALGTTMAQLARGGFDNDDWYMGFNISRRFN
jgi:Membrane bound beta barrel domain (DUF5777)